MQSFIKKYLLAIISFLIYLIIKWNNIQLIPDLLNLNKCSPSDYFSLLIGTTASIFGILITVILLTFEWLKHISFKNSEENILNKNVVTNFVSIAISIIILSFISYIYIQNFNEGSNLTEAYFIGILFVLFIVFLFPVTKSILDTANTLNKTKREIDNLAFDHFKQIQFSEDNKFISKNSNITLVMIRQELLSAVRESDYEVYSIILEKLNSKVIALVGNGENRQECDLTLQGVTFVWKASVFEALRVGNHQYYETIWECIQELYEYAANEKVPLLHYQYLEFFIRDFISFLNRNNLNDSLATGVKIFSTCFKLQLKYNCPNQENISELYYLFEKESKVLHNVHETLQWNHINELVRLINTIQSSAIDRSDKELFGVCKFELKQILHEINYGYFANIGNYQEGYIVITIIADQSYYGFVANQEKLFKDSMWSYDIDPALIRDYIVNQKFYVGRVLSDISDFIIKSLRQETLDQYISLNDWGGLGRLLSQHYSENKLAKKSLFYIVETFEMLKNEIEISNLATQAKIYNEIKKQITSIKNSLLRVEINKSDKIIEKIDSVLIQFKEVNTPNDFNILKWEE